MLTFSYGYLGFTPAAEVFPPAPVLDFLKNLNDLKEYRVAKDRVPIPHDAGMIYGFEAADGYEITTERTRTFTADLAEDRPDGVMFLAEKILQSRDRRFDMLNVKYLLVSAPSPQFDQLQLSGRFLPIYFQGSVAVFENRNVLPRIFVVPASGVEAIHEQSGQLKRVREVSFDPSQSVILSEKPNRLESVNPIDQPLPAKIEVVERTMNRSKFRIQSSVPAVAVVSQTYYPGWKAIVNGQDAPVYPADYALTGIVISAGLSDVELLFRPFLFQLGAGISLISLVIIMLLTFNRLARRSDGQQHGTDDKKTPQVHRVSAGSRL
jgi:hypothetical protein